MPIPAGDRMCSPAAISLPVLADPKRTIRKSRMGPRRAAVLIAIHILIGIHILHWVIRGMTLSPVEPSESMYTINNGELNAGFVFFALAILSTLILGRFFCGWGCHIVAVQDLCGWMMKRIGIHPRPFRSRLLVWAPVVLATYMFAWPTIRREVIRPVLGPSLWSSVAPYIGEAGVRPEIRAAFVKTNFWETFAPWYIAIPFIGVCGFACVYFLGAKGFCTYGCPYGGIFGPVDRLAPGRIRVTDACEHCGHCTAVCTSNVRVHEEVRDYGMVVDPGCMKCMDCVSVCPNDALYFGFGAPAALAKPRASAPTPRFKTRVYDLSRLEEFLYGLAFLALVIGFRGFFGVVPLLMAIGVAGIATFLLWKVFGMVRLPNVRIHGLQLRLRGRIRPVGAAVAASTMVLLGLGVWGLFVNASAWRGNSLDARILTPLDEVLTRGYVAPPADRKLADRAAAHLRRIGPLSDGGAGWDRSIDRTLRLARLDVIAGDLARAEADLKLWLTNASNRGTPPPGAIEDPLIRVLALRATSAEMYERSLRALLSEQPRLAATRLSLAPLVAARGEQNEAITLIQDGLAARPDDIRNLFFASDMLVQLERLDLATEAVSAAVKRNSQSAPLHERLGLLLAAGGQLEQGLEQLKRAAELDPSSPTAPSLIAGLLREAGRLEEAKSWETRIPGSNGLERK